MANQRKVRRGEGAVRAAKREKIEVAAQQIVLRSRIQSKNFLEFIRERGVVSLAVGIILGTAITALVRSLVDDIINPLIGLVLVEKDLSILKLQAGKATLGLGNFLSTLIDFMIIALVVYLIFKVLGLEKIDKGEAKKPNS